MTASVTLSIEIELGWGAARGDPVSETPLSNRRTAETHYLNRLVALADEIDIPITFDVVGHLLQSTCDGAHSGPYTPGWFDIDPASDRQTDPLYYSPDLVTTIRDATTNHEIATHTYSHIHCDEESAETLSLELERATECHRELGLSPPGSIVAPYHEEPSYDVLVENDIDIIRRPNPDYSVPEKGIKRFGWNLLSPHPVHECIVSKGVIETYCTPHPSLTSGILQNGTRPPRSEYRYLPVRVRQILHYRSLVRAVQSAIESDSEVHLWTHLYNLANEQQWRPINSFLEWLADSRNDGRITIDTMNDLAEKYV